MTHKEVVQKYYDFRDKYNGKYIDYDKQFGNQCWDEVQFFLVHYLGIPEYVLGGCDLVSNMLYPPKRNDLDKYFDEVPTTEMCPGDVCIWEYGHIALFDNWDGNKCWYFSQNPNPCQVMVINAGGLHAFRLKEEKPKITPNVERNENINQVYVNVSELRVRTTPSLNGDILGFASIGYYNVLEQTEADNYTWFKIDNDNWIAYSPEWEDYYPIQEDDYKKLYEDALLIINIKDEKIKELENKIIKAIEDLQ